MLPAMISLNCAAPPSRCTMRKMAPGAASSAIRMARWSSRQDAGGGGADGVGRLLGGVDQVLQRLVGAVRPDPDDARVEHLVDDRREVLLGEDRLALGIEDDRVGGRQVDEADVVAVRLLAHQLGPAHLAAGAALVHDDDRLAEHLLGDRGDDAGGDVGRAARPGRRPSAGRAGWGSPARRRRRSPQGERHERRRWRCDDARHH